jgi:ferric-dicitrate binding protein FerR (iron transport regulator)
MSGSIPGEIVASDERALRESLRAADLSAEALLRIRRAAENEWRRNIARPRRVRALAASLWVLTALAGAALWNVISHGENGTSMAHLSRADAPGVIAIRRWRSDAPLAVGSQMRVGQTFEARGVALVALRDGGNLRLRPDSRFHIEGANAVWLERGEMYVDIPPRSHTDEAFVARTAAGEFRHVGTQFALAIVDGTTRLRVREGAVLWRTQTGDSTVTAGTEVVIDRNQHPVRRPIDVVGSDWAWTEALTPDVDIENRQLVEFLRWVARETGRELLLADDEARRLVFAIRMHGDVRGLTTMQALTAVMASTTLSFELSAGVIRVSFPGAAPKPISK